MASKVNDIRKSELECLLGIAEYLLARGRSADVVAQAICADARLTASRAMGIDFTPFAPRYLRTVAQRCRELADALDEEALKLVEEFVNEE